MSDEDRIGRRHREVRDGPAKAGHKRLDRELEERAMSDEDRDHRDVHADQQRFLAREAEWEALDEDLDRYFDEERDWPAPRPVSTPQPLLTYTERELLASIVSKVAAAYVLIGSDRAALQLTILAAKVRP